MNIVCGTIYPIPYVLKKEERFWDTITLAGLTSRVLLQIYSNFVIDVEIKGMD